MKEKRLISFTRDMLKRLKIEAHKRDLSVTELIRNIVDKWFLEQDKVIK